MTEEAKKQEGVETAEKPAGAGESTKPKVNLSDKLEGLIKTVEGMTVIELSELVKGLEERFGVSAAAPLAATAASASGGAPAAEAEEKTIFSVVLKDVGAQKIQVIKEVRALTDLGLKEAKDLVESAPKEIKGGLNKEDAEKFKKQLEAVGAKIELK